MKRTQTIGFKLSIVILIFLLLVLGSCGVLTYYNQMAIYHQQCETDVRNVGECLSNIIAMDGAEFARYQAYYLEHYDEIDLPMDADSYVPYQTAYAQLFEEVYPGKTLGVDIAFDDLSDEVKRAWLAYRHLFWIMTFDQMRSDFDLKYVYYIIPHSEKESVTYMIDCVRTSRAEHIAMIEEYPVYGMFDHPQGDEAEYLYLGDEVYNSKAEYDVQWAAWESEEHQTGFQIWHNAFGNTYAYYTPLVIDGQKMGLIVAEVDIERVNTVILRNTLQQFLVIGLILVTGMLILVTLINHCYVRRIAELEQNVRQFAKTKDAAVAHDSGRHARQGRDQFPFGGRGPDDRGDQGLCRQPGQGPSGAGQRPNQRRHHVGSGAQGRADQHPQPHGL